MKKFFYYFILASFIFTANLLAQANFPSLTGRVVDNAQILTTSQIKSLTAILKKHEEQTSNQIVILTLKNLDGYEIADYGYQVARYWQLGQKDKNNGVLLLISLDDRKLRIEVGYGLEGVLTDKISHEIIEYTIKPEFKKGEYYQGISKGATAIIKSIKGEYTKSSSPQTYKDESFISLLPFEFLGFITLFIFVFLPRIIRLIGFSLLFGFLSGIFALLITSSGIVFFIVFLIVSITLFIKFKNASFTNSSSYSSGSSFSSSSSFGSSSSSFSGSGGSFGGGGASGSW
ncbi:TPM domain-containing protein [Malaciobacter canalis]|uniref:TPM domain-containing protein n=1 Tax=Malaciobacter canalis TaxID=1912871 RepID=UPI00384AE78D